MSDLLNRWRVGDLATRLILLRVEPGFEIEVGRLIEKRCKALFPKTNTFRVFRLFGSYDLLIIQDNARLSHSDFVNVGSIPHVTGSTEYICNKWVDRQNRAQGPSFKLSQLSDPLLALCFLKINPEITQRFGLLSELSLASYTQRQLPSVQMLSTFGWAEVVLLISGKSLAEILDVIFTHLQALLFAGTSTLPHLPKFFVEKTLTMIAHNLDLSDPRRSMRVRSVPLGNVQDLTIGFSVTCKPTSSPRVARLAAKYFGKNAIRSRLGARDLEVNVSVTASDSFNCLLKKLDEFRAESGRSLIRTHTLFKYHRGFLRTDAKPVKRRRFYIRLTPREAKKLTASGPQGAAVATAIYQFNNLIQNEISSDVYLDLLRFVIALKKEAIGENSVTESSGGNNEPSRATFDRIIAQKLSHLDLALVQRSQSAYAALEENPFGSYPAGIGLQRVLKALDAYALTILASLGRTWNGFVRFAHQASRMEHFVDILLIPMDVSVSAWRHWTFTHETMHVLQAIDPNNLSLSKILRCDPSGTERSGSALVPGTNPWIVLSESMADILDFSLCCPLSLDDYLQTIWKYLDAEIFDQQADLQLTTYLSRSFAVIAYCYYQDSNRDVRRLFQRDTMLALLKRHVREFARLTDLSKLTKKDQRGQDVLTWTYDRFLNEFVFYLPSVFRRVDEIASSLKRVSTRSVTAAVKRLENGQLLTQQQAQYAANIAWQMAERTLSKGTRRNVAWLLSLWHYYQVAGLGPDIRLLTRQTKSK